jgi:ketosteroid isomerase-like protein
MDTGKDLWTEVKALYNQGDLSGWAASYARDAVCTDPTGRQQGREVIAAYMEDADRPFTDSRTQTTLLVEEGNTVVAEWTWRAAQATGRTVELPGVAVITVRDGKLVTWHDYFDSAAIMTQVGLIPGTERSAPGATSTMCQAGPCHTQAPYPSVDPVDRRTARRGSWLSHPPPTCVRSWSATLNFGTLATRKSGSPT